MKLSSPDISGLCINFCLPLSRSVCLSLLFFVQNKEMKTYRCVAYCALSSGKLTTKSEDNCQDLTFKVVLASNLNLKGIRKEQVSISQPSSSRILHNAQQSVNHPITVEETTSSSFHPVTNFQGASCQFSPSTCQKVRRTQLRSKYL